MNYGLWIWIVKENCDAYDPAAAAAAEICSH